MKISGYKGQFLISDISDPNFKPILCPTLNDAQRIAGIEPEMIGKDIVAEIDDDDEDFKELLKLLD